MFVYSFKLSRKKIIYTVIVLVCVIIGIVIGLNSIFASKDDGTSESDVSNITRVDNAATPVSDVEIVSFLQSFGWEVTQTPIEQKEVTIPGEFDTTYAQYNKIQTEQGYDLMAYRGKTVMRYTYEVKNYPDRPNFIRANVLVYDKQIIGGDICSISLSGFMHGFKLVEG